jgi:hypothetical protein
LKDRISDHSPLIVDLNLAGETVSRRE